MENTKTNVIGQQEFDEDKVYSTVHNKTKNQKVVLSSLNGIEIAPGQTVNLREMFRKAQLVDAAQEIYHFIQYGALEDLSGKKIVPEDQGHSQVQFQEELQKKVQIVKNRDLIAEIKDCTLLTRLEDILTSPETVPEVKREAKIRYMQLRGWVDDDAKIIEGSMDDSQQDISSIDSWEFQPFDISRQVTV